MTEQSNHKAALVLWIETLVSPMILGLVFGGISYTCSPNNFGLKLGIVLIGFGIIAGIATLAIRMMKNKGPITFFPGRKS